MWMLVQAGVDVGQRVTNRDVDLLVEEELVENAHERCIIFQEQHMCVRHRQSAGLCPVTD
jgi:hypothetical protein